MEELALLYLLISVLITNFSTATASVTELLFQSLDLPYSSKNNFSFSNAQNEM